MSSPTPSLTIPSLPFTDTEHGITYRLMTSTEVNQVSSTIASAFAAQNGQGNILCEAVNSTYEDMNGIAQFLVNMWMSDKLIVVAIKNSNNNDNTATIAATTNDNTTIINNNNNNDTDPHKDIRTHDGIMIGCAVSSDAWCDPTQSSPPPPFAIPTLLHELEKPWYELHPNLTQHTVCYLHFLAVPLAYRRLHVAWNLCIGTYSIAREYGYTSVITEAAHVATERIWTVKLGGKVTHGIWPADFKWIPPTTSDNNENKDKDNTTETSTETETSPSSSPTPSYPFASVTQHVTLCECPLLSDAEIAKRHV